MEMQDERQEIENPKSLSDDTNDAPKDALLSKNKLKDDYTFKPKPYKLCCSQRLTVALLASCGMMLLYGLRVNMSVAIVCMVNYTAVHLAENISVDGVSLSDSECPANNQSEGYSETAFEDGEFVWSRKFQGILHSSFFWGYLLTQVPGAWLAHKYGGQKTFGWSIFVNSMTTLLTPVGARLHYTIILALRFIGGLSQGTIFPALHTVWSNWAPPMERSRLIGFSFAGTQMGTLIIMSMSGLLCEYAPDNGWPFIFYVSGTIGVLWFIAWMLLTDETPAKSIRISDEEQEYIEMSLRGQMSKEKKKIPWLQFFKSKPFLGICVAHFCGNWGIFTFLTNIPSYLQDVLKFNIASNGIISSVPYLAFWAVVVISGILADKIKKRKLLSPTWTRKLFNTVGILGPAIFLVALANVGCSQTMLAVVLLVCGVAINGCEYSGVFVNHADIAPSFAGIMFGISNTVACLSGLGAPALIGFLTQNHLRTEWQQVFYITAAIMTFGAIFYLFTASGELQPWANVHKIEISPTENEEQC